MQPPRYFFENWLVWRTISGKEMAVFTARLPTPSTTSTAADSGIVIMLPVISMGFVFVDSAIRTGETPLMDALCPLLRLWKSVGKRRRIALSIEHDLHFA